MVQAYVIFLASPFRILYLCLSETENVTEDIMMWRRKDDAFKPIFKTKNIRNYI